MRFIIWSGMGGLVACGGLVGRLSVADADTRRRSCNAQTSLEAAQRHGARGGRKRRCDADVVVGLLTGAGQSLPPKYGVRWLVERAERRRAEDEARRPTSEDVRCVSVGVRSHFRLWFQLVIVPCDAVVVIVRGSTSSTWHKESSELRE